MKAYGYKRVEKLTCKYGCCTIRKGSDKPVYVRRARKAARQDSKRLVQSIRME